MQQAHQCEGLLTDWALENIILLLDCCRAFYLKNLAEERDGLEDNTNLEGLLLYAFMHVLVYS